MKSVLDEKVVVLNRAWQVISETTVRLAIPQLCIGAATSMAVDGDQYYPMTWEQWVSLPLRDGIDLPVRSQKLTIRAPRVIIAVNYSKIPKRRPKLNLRSIRERDGNKCAYTGKVLSVDESSIDHVVPRCRGGGHDFLNTVLADKKINNAKGSKTLQESGLKLLSKPKAPLEKVPSQYIKPSHPDHELFLKK